MDVEVSHVSYTMLGPGLSDRPMRLCFLVEEQYRHDGMPVEVIRQLTAWGHQVDVLRPGSSLLRLSDVVRAGSHDAWVLKTVSGGPGLSLLEAAAAVGLTTVNDARSIRGVRDKALAAAIGRSRGLPMPPTYAAARAGVAGRDTGGGVPAGGQARRRQLRDGPWCWCRHRTGWRDGPARVWHGEGMLIAQPYVPNSGVDLKVYCVGGELFATERASPLHPGPPGAGAPGAAVRRGRRDSRRRRGGLRTGSVRRGRPARPGRPGGRRCERLPELPSSPGRGGPGGAGDPRTGPYGGTGPPRRCFRRRARAGPEPRPLPASQPAQAPAQVAGRARTRRALPPPPRHGPAPLPPQVPAGAGDGR